MQAYKPIAHMGEKGYQSAGNADYLPFNIPKPARFSAEVFIKPGGGYIASLIKLMKYTKIDTVRSPVRCAAARGERGIGCRNMRYGLAALFFSFGNFFQCPKTNDHRCDTKNYSAKSPSGQHAFRPPLLSDVNKGNDT